MSFQKTKRTGKSVLRYMRPNILLLFSDQHKASVLGCEGHPDVATPHLDALARDGTRFSRAYCQDAICVPSRCSMLTGLYPRSFGSMDFRHMAGNHNDLAPYFAPTLWESDPMQKIFQDAGYATAAFGKRHLYEPCDTGWDTTASHLPDESPSDDYLGWIQGRGLSREAAEDWAAELGQGLDGTLIDGKTDQFAPLATRASRLPDDATMEAFTASRTRQFLRERSKDSQPFFCWSSFYRPHQPYTPLPRYWDRHDRTRWGRGTNAGDALFMPGTLREDPAKLPPFLRGWFHGRNRVWCLDQARQDEQLYRNYISAYYALVEEIDHHVGAILSDLDALGMAENTIVLVASDHGDFVGSHGMVEKCSAGHNVYEDTLRVPLIVRWPGKVREGAVRADLTELVDLYPTLIDLCQLPAPRQSLDGRSLARTLCNGEPVGRSYCVSENWAQATVITERFKLGHWKAPDDAGIHFDFREFGDMLFDLERDPGETRNIFSTVPEVLRVELMHLLAEWEEKHPLRRPTMPPGLRELLESILRGWTANPL